MAKAKDQSAAAASYCTPSNITTFYRQNLSHFLFHSHASLVYPTDGPTKNNSTTSSWIDETARSLALRAATPFFAAETPVNVKNPNTQNNDQTKKSRKESSTTNNTKGSAAADNIVRTLPPQWSDYVCTTCGTFLFPPKTSLTANTTDNDITGYGGNNNSTATPPINFQISQAKASLLPSNIYIRPAKRGRTRRRRSSRSKAKHLHNHALSLQRRGGASNLRHIQLLNKGTLHLEEVRRIASSYCVGDGRAKNVLVMSCNFCGTKKKRKGVEVEKRRGGTSTTQVAAGRVEQNSSVRTKKQYEKQQHQSPHVSRGESSRGENVTSQIRDNSDFISLSPMMMGRAVVGKNRKSAGQQQTPDWKDAQHANKRKSDDVFTSPLLGGKKKKKKKKPDVKKGELMDFLSSLND